MLAEYAKRCTDILAAQKPTLQGLIELCGML
jgi:hypothetical protein